MSITWPVSILAYHYNQNEKYQFSITQLNLNASGTREIRVRAGEPLKIDVPIDGAPTPAVTWKKNGKEVPESSRVRQAKAWEI